MDRGLYFTFCVIATTLLLRESSQTGEKNDPKMPAASKTDFVLLYSVNSFSL